MQMIQNFFECRPLLGEVRKWNRCQPAYQKPEVIIVEQMNSAKISTIFYIYSRKLAVEA